MTELFVCIDEATPEEEFHSWRVSDNHGVVCPVRMPSTSRPHVGLFMVENRIDCAILTTEDFHMAYHCDALVGPNFRMSDNWYLFPRSVAAPGWVAKSYADPEMNQVARTAVARQRSGEITDLWLDLDYRISWLGRMFQAIGYEFQEGGESLSRFAMRIIRSNLIDDVQRATIREGWIKAFLRFAAQWAHSHKFEPPIGYNEERWR